MGIMVAATVKNKAFPGGNALFPWERIRDISLGRQPEKQNWKPQLGGEVPGGKPARSPRQTARKQNWKPQLGGEVPGGKRSASVRSGPLSSSRGNSGKQSVSWGSAAQGSVANVTGGRGNGGVRFFLKRGIPLVRSGPLGSAVARSGRSRHVHPASVRRPPFVRIPDGFVDGSIRRRWFQRRHRINGYSP